jgi:diguanylate cyclase (GGDEF)-like protein
MVLDLDHFKQVNDTHGHDVGDEVLRAVAGCLKDLTRYHDVSARLGGEEFAVLVPNMDDAQLMKFAERIRKAIATMPILSGNVRLKITTSVGLAVWDGRETAEDFYRRADKQLYHAKRAGRNQVSA